MLNRFLDPLFMRILEEEANKIVDTAKDNASWSSAIPDAISVENPVNLGGGQYQITIKVDVKQAPMAAAFEYGSGLYDPVQAHLIPIETTKYPNLGFFWEKGGHWWKGPKLTFGHPGVKPKPYLQPAIDKHKPSILARIVGIFKQGFLDSIKAEFNDIQTQ